jgi:hypothetical protein
VNQGMHTALIAPPDTPPNRAPRAPARCDVHRQRGGALRAAAPPPPRRTLLREWHAAASIVTAAAQPAPREGACRAATWNWLSHSLAPAPAWCAAAARRAAAHPRSRKPCIASHACARRAAPPPCVALRCVACARVHDARLL